MLRYYLLRYKEFTNTFLYSNILFPIQIREIISWFNGKEIIYVFGMMQYLFITSDL